MQPRPFSVRKENKSRGRRDLSCVVILKHGAQTRESIRVGTVSEIEHFKGRRLLQPEDSFLRSRILDKSSHFPQSFLSRNWEVEYWTKRQIPSVFPCCPIEIAGGKGAWGWMGWHRDCGRSEPEPGTQTSCEKWERRVWDQLSSPQDWIRQRCLNVYLAIPCSHGTTACLFLLCKLSHSI